MKQKIMLCLLLAGSFYLTTNAQIQKGKWIGGLTLNGENKSYNDYSNNAFDSKYLENLIGANIVINKMVTKNVMVGVGFNFNTFMKSYYSIQVASNSTRSLEEYYGPTAQVGYYKEVAKNLYLSSIIQIRYNYFGGTKKLDYNYPTERRIKNDGRQVDLIVTPLQLNYLFKNRYLVSLNLATLNYYHRRLNRTNSSSYFNEENYNYSLNPFKNGISFSYIF